MNNNINSNQYFQKTKTTPPAMKTHINPYLKRASIAVAALTALMTTGNATVLFSDNFTGMQTGPASSADLNADGWYFTGANAGNTPFRVDVDNTAPLSGNAMQNYGSSANFTYALKQFSATTLSNIGDSITLSLDYHAATAAASYLYVALMNTSATVTSDAFGVADPISDASGYGMIQYPWTAVYDLVKPVNDPDVFSLAGLSATGSGYANLGTSGAAYSLTLSLLKVATGTQVSLNINGSQVFIATDTTSPYYTFNTVRLMDSPDSGTYAFVDNISVITNVPEPSIVALLVVGGCGILFACRLKLTRRA